MVSTGPSEYPQNSSGHDPESKALWFSGSQILTHGHFIMSQNVGTSKLHNLVIISSHRKNMASECGIQPNPKHKPDM